MAEFKLKEMDKTRNYFMEEIKQNELISKKHKKLCKILKYAEHLLILAATVSGCVSISALASLIGIPVGIASFATTIKITIIIPQIKKHKSIVKKNEKTK